MNQTDLILALMELIVYQEETETPIYKQIHMQLKLC